MSMGKKFRVMVLAMSILTNPLNPRKGTTYTAFDDRYVYQRDPKKKKYHGIGQLESVPQYIFDRFGAITHFIILQTPEVKKAVKGIDWGEVNEKIKKGDGASIGDDNESLSAIGFFKKRIKAFYRKKAEEENKGEFKKAPKFICVNYSENKPEKGLAKLLNKIQELYAECLKENGEEKIDKCWELFIDVHGGFRTTSMAMFALIQTLSAPDLNGGIAHDLNAAIARLTDGKGTIPISGVYTVNYDPNKVDHTIVNKTRFYQLFVKESLEAYMNYGQYAQLALKPTVDDPENSDPYAFISYRRMDAPKERFAFLGVLKKEKYRYWYDDAIKLQSNWGCTLKKAVDNCHVFIALISRHYYESYQCLKELREAIDENKLILLFALDDENLYNIKHDVSADLKEDVYDASGNVVGEKIVDTAKVSKDELDKILDIQHMQLKDLLQNGVFQHEVLKKKLDELCEADGKFRSIKED